MKLLIVESPTKSKKLRQFLGQEYRIAASFGHVRDLPPSGGLAVRFVDGKVEPDYVPLERSARAIADLRSQAAKADEVLLATDPDREGEAIAWHVAELIGVTDGGKRVTFNAVTKKAVLQAVANSRPIDTNLVGAQQARRVLDRVVGWVVSPTLRRGLSDRGARSAGRVQSVALRIVAEREREIQNFTAVDYFVLEARLSHAEKPPPFTARLVEWKGEPLEHRLADAAIAERTVDWCRRQDWRVVNLDKREQRRNPPPPFVTATAQQAASVKLKLTPKKTMQLLQQLFENGHITYHRTDSVAVDPEAIAAARKIIAERFEPEYLPAKPVQHAGKAANTQEAHEAIRPTHPETGPTTLGQDDAGKLYQLIWERFIASQMAPGRDFLTSIKVGIAPDSFSHPTKGQVPMGICEAKGKVILFPGWRALTDDQTEERQTKKKGKVKGKADAEDQAQLPDLAVGDDLNVDKLAAVKKSTKAPPRYTQASLIKKLEQLGIGRPSTYATIMTTLLERDYVFEKQRKLHAADLGMRVVDYLCRQFKGNFIDVDYTARMEEQLDAIARGETDWQAAITTASQAVTGLAQRAGLPYNPLAGEGPKPPEPSEHRCPLCGKEMLKRDGRYGPFIACTDRACGAILNPDGTPNKKTQQRLDKRDKGKGGNKG